MTLKIEELTDIDATLTLHAKYQADSIQEADKADGFVITAFTRKEFTGLIAQEQGLFIAKEGEEILVYVMSGSWQFWSQWPMFQGMIKDLPPLEYLGQTLSVENSYQYAPVCIDKSLLGSSMLQKIFNFSLNSMQQRYPIMVTFVNKTNPFSHQAHRQKLELDIIKSLQF